MLHVFSTLTTKKTFYIMLMFGICHSILGMENNSEQAHDKKIIIYKVPSLNKQDHFEAAIRLKIQESYSKNPQKNTIFFNANILTYKPLIKDLVKASEKGVDVHLLLAQKSLQYGKNIHAYFQQLPTFIYTTKKENEDEISENHAKVFAYNINGQTGYAIGSSNSSPYGLFHNTEMNVYIKNDPKNYTLLLEKLKMIEKKSITYKDYINKVVLLNSPLKSSKNDLKTTPKKKHTVHTTLDKNLISLILDRLNPEKFSAGDNVWLSTYTFNSPEIIDALIKLHDMKVAINVYIDKNPLTTHVGRKQMLQLVEKGIKVYAYIRSDRKRYINHAKFLLIERKGNEETQKVDKKITIISTQNFLESQAFEALSLDQDETTFNTMQQVIDAYKKNDSNFIEITTTNIDTLAPLSKKRKLFDENDENKENEGIIEKKQKK